jgi:hypothetical protein
LLAGLFEADRFRAFPLTGYLFGLALHLRAGKAKQSKHQDQNKTRQFKNIRHNHSSLVIILTFLIDFFNDGQTRRASAIALFQITAIKLKLSSAIAIA